MVAATSAIGSAAVSQTVRASEPLTAMDLAQEIHSAALLLSREIGDGVPATTGAEVRVLDDLDGAIFSPPIDASLENISAMAGWSQAVSLAPMDLNQPSLPAAADAGDAAFLQLTVTIRSGGEFAGTYTWWITP